MLYVIKKVFKLIKPYKKIQFIGVMFTLFAALGSFLTPLASEYLVDEVLIADNYKKLLYGILIFVIVCLIQPFAGIIRDIIFIRITENVTSDIRKNLFNKIIHTNFMFFSRLKSGDILSIIMNDGRGASNFISNLFSMFIKDIILVILIVTGMCLKSWKITLLVFGVFLIYFVVNYKFTSFNRKLSKQVQENYDDICGCINQTYNGILAIKSYNTEEIETEKFNSIINRMKKTNVKMDTFRGLSNGATNMILISCLGIIYGLGAYLVLTKQLTVGNVIALGLYFQLLEQPFFELTNMGINTHVILPILERLEKYDNLVQEEAGELDENFEFSNIKISNLNFAYEYENSEKEIRKTDILNNVTLDIPEKGLIILRGASGSGKSTFIRILMGLLPIGRDMVFFGDADINDITHSTLRKCFAYVPQDLELLNDTFYNNLTYGLEDISIEDVKKVCRRIKLSSRIENAEDSYNTVVNEKADLSGGEKQRILIARAILKDSPVIVLDEPSSALDSENKKIVNDIISELAEDKLVFLISHDDIEPDIPCNVLQFEDGNIIINCEGGMRQIIDRNYKVSGNAC